MSLHGEIKVNDTVIGEWKADNHGNVGDEVLYVCLVKYRDRGGYPNTRTFELLHLPGRGAMMLASAVLAEAATRINP